MGFGLSGAYLAKKKVRFDSKWSFLASIVADYDLVFYSQEVVVNLTAFDIFIIYFEEGVEELD